MRDFAKAKVDDFDVLVLGVDKAHVARLDVAMHNANVVQRGEAVQQLAHNVARARHVHHLLILVWPEQLQQVAAAQQLGHNPHALLVLKDVEQAHEILVAPQQAQNTDFLAQHGALGIAVNALLVNDLDRHVVLARLASLFARAHHN